MVAISRIMLPNVIHIQASWLTVGKQTAQLCLHSGADDMGSIMIEENVVSAAGAPFRFTADGIQQAIRDAGIGGVGVAVDDPGDLSMGNLLFTQLIGNIHQLGEGR